MALMHLMLSLDERVSLGSLIPANRDLQILDKMEIINILMEAGRAEDLNTQGDITSKMKELRIQCDHASHIKDTYMVVELVTASLSALRDMSWRKSKHFWTCLK